jgi:hypothetical protein
MAGVSKINSSAVKVILLAVALALVVAYGVAYLKLGDIADEGQGRDGSRAILRVYRYWWIAAAFKPAGWIDWAMTGRHATLDSYDKYN